MDCQCHCQFQHRTQVSQALALEDDGTGLVQGAAKGGHVILLPVSHSAEVPLAVNSMLQLHTLGVKHGLLLAASPGLCAQQVSLHSGEAFGCHAVQTLSTDAPQVRPQRGSVSEPSTVLHYPRLCWSLEATAR